MYMCLFVVSIVLVKKLYMICYSVFILVRNYIIKLQLTKVTATHVTAYISMMHASKNLFNVIRCGCFTKNSVSLKNRMIL